MVRKTEYLHQHGEISRLAKVFTNNSNPTNDPAHSEPLQQLVPPPSEEYNHPRQMGVDSTHHWSTEIEINDSWNTQQTFERITKYHSIPALTKYIRSRSLLSAPDIDGWRMKNIFQHIFLSSDFWVPERVNWVHTLEAHVVHRCVTPPPPQAWHKKRRVYTGLFDLARSSAGVSICTFVPVKQVNWAEYQCLARSSAGVRICTFVQ